MDRWLARFSFSFFIFAFVLIWELYKSLEGFRGYVPPWRIALYAFATAIFIVLGVLGVRARHKTLDR
jgi:hypothetical protein